MFIKISKSGSVTAPHVLLEPVSILWGCTDGSMAAVSPQYDCDCVL